jgi:hypothetical protein
MASEPLRLELHGGLPWGVPGIIPSGRSAISVDALEEFRIQTSTFAPEYGCTPGVQILVVTKSGTNTLLGATGP